MSNILNANYTTLKLALDSISNDHPEKLHHDMFDFLVNVQRGQNLALNNKANYLKQFDINAKHKGIMVNYAVTRKNDTPRMLLLDENFAKSVIEELDAEGKDSSQWQTNLEILYKITEEHPDGTYDTDNNSTLIEIKTDQIAWQSDINYKFRNIEGD